MNTTQPQHDITRAQAEHVVSSILSDIEDALRRAIETRVEAITNNPKSYVDFTPQQIQLMEEIVKQPDRLIAQTLIGDSGNGVLLLKYVKDAGLKEEKNWWAAH